MANLKEVRTRIASVSSTQQITSAMKMVSAAKFRRAQNAIIGMRPYSAQLDEIVADINIEDGVSTPYHEVRKADKVLLVVVTSNKGLCGAFNSNVIKLATSRLAELRKTASQVTMITLGKRCSEFFRKQQGLVETSYDDLLDNPSFDAVAAIADDIMQRFRDKVYDRVEVIYNQFKNSLTQILSDDVLLPLKHSGQNSKAKQSPQANDYIFEPSKQEILREMVPLMIRSYLYRVVLDSLAAEHGARMTAMQKATDNATELLKDLKHSYNKARQATLTNEIIEIVSGSEALKG